MRRLTAELYHIDDVYVKPSLSCTNTDDLTRIGLSGECGGVDLFLSVIDSNELANHIISKSKCVLCITSFLILCFIVDIS